MTDLRRSSQEMNPRAEIWNILHDGGITSVVGDTPGNVSIRVNIPYLCQMFSPDGKDVIVHLRNCTRFTMNIWDEGMTTSDLDRIATIRTTILSTESEDAPVHIVTTLGEIDMDFDDFSLSLDSGISISFEDIGTACKTYWNRWEEQTKAEQQSDATNSMTDLRRSTKI